MTLVGRSLFNAQGIFKSALGCWNWKCALMSATARSLVYLAAMARTGLHGGVAIVAVEMAYVTLTAGIYAGLQQKALGLRSRLLGNLTVVIAVPMAAQLFDWLTHHISGAPVPARATLSVCVFAILSALFHLHVMRRGAFLTGQVGHSLLEDFRRIPRLTLGFVLLPVTLLGWMTAWLAGDAESEPAL
jgi:hypothetical protein